MLWILSLEVVVYGIYALSSLLLFSIADDGTMWSSIRQSLGGIDVDRKMLQKSCRNSSSFDSINVKHVRVLLYH